MKENPTSLHTGISSRAQVPAGSRGQVHKLRRCQELTQRRQNKKGHWVHLGCLVLFLPHSLPATNSFDESTVPPQTSLSICQIWDKEFKLNPVSVESHRKFLSRIWHDKSGLLGRGICSWCVAGKLLQESSQSQWWETRLK